MRRVKYSEKVKFYFLAVITILVCCFNPLISYSADIKVDMYPIGDSQINPVSLLFNGKLYVESWWFDEVASGLFPASDEEKFIIKMFDANKNGTPQDILNLWAPAERDSMKPDIFDTKLFSANRGYFNNIQYAAFMAKIQYGSYSIYLIQHTGSQIGNDIDEYIIKKIDNNYYQTNALQSDPVYLYISQKYAGTLTYKIRRTLTSITITPMNQSLAIGTTQQFTAVGAYSDNTTQDLTTQVTWSSSDTTVATISNTAGSNGLASSITTGLTTITATLGSISGSTTITVIPATP